jgi:hypothetical protein
MIAAVMVSVMLEYALVTPASTAQIAPLVHVLPIAMVRVPVILPLVYVHATRAGLEMIAKQLYLRESRVLATAMGRVIEIHKRAFARVLRGGKVKIATLHQARQ